MARLDSMAGVLDHLDLSRDNVAAQARFYTSYARSLENARGRNDGSVWARIANPNQPWLGAATIASTYRLAAQYMALIDMRMAMRLAVRASLAYLEEGLHFGLLLATGLLDDSLLRDPFVVDRIAQLMSRPEPGDRASDPVQQSYLLLALASRPWLQDLVGRSVEAMFAELAAHDLHPVGPQSIPLSTYVDLARMMFTQRQTDALVLAAGDQGAESPMVPQLVDIGTAQAGSLRRTMRNRYLWRHAAAPVNLIDLEQVALYGLAVRSSPAESERLLAATMRRLADVDVLAEVPGWACGEMGRVQEDVAPELSELLRGYSWRRGPDDFPEYGPRG